MNAFAQEKQKTLLLSEWKSMRERKDAKDAAQNDYL